MHSNILQRQEWAAAHGWDFTPRRDLSLDLFARTSWDRSLPRNPATSAEGEIRGRYAGRTAFAHDRLPSRLRGGGLPQEYFLKVAGVSATVDLPVTFALLARRGFEASIFPVPGSRGLTTIRRPLRGTSALWVQPGAEDQVLTALSPLLEHASQIVLRGSGSRYLIGCEGRTVLVGEPDAGDMTAVRYRLDMAADVAARLEAVLSTAA